VGGAGPLGAGNGRSEIQFMDGLLSISGDTNMFHVPQLCGESCVDPTKPI
jgi:hypothetical protein